MTDENTNWPNLKPLPNGLHPVPKFDVNFLPKSLAPLVEDIADRMQCPEEFVGVPVIVALGALIGSKIGIKPEANTDWLEVPNLWSILVGRPGAMKSPAVSEALGPLNALQKRAFCNNEKAMEAHEVAKKVYSTKKKALDKELEEAVEAGTPTAAIEQKILALKEPVKPEPLRYILTDVTYEKLGEISAKNPQGVLVHRDEIVGLLSDLAREENASARGFYLQGWNGTSSYVFDRIGRGTIHIDTACISILGTTQPAKLASYIHAANTGGKGDDGLIQRFGLLVWPDAPQEWVSTDRYPDSAAKASAMAAFEELAKLSANDLTRGEYALDEKIAFLRFTEEARVAFVEWRTKFERKIRSNELSPALESHFSKYRKLVPTLALINYLADGGRSAVDLASLKKALAFIEYLGAHAVRCYGSGLTHAVNVANAIVRRLKKQDLVDGFTARQIYSSGWSGLSDVDTVKAGLEILVEANWLSEKVMKAETNGGRPTIRYLINPNGLK